MDISNLDDDFIPENAQPLCPECLQPCNPMQDYCNNCGSNEPLNPLSSYMPFVCIRFNVGMFGKIWRRIRDDKNTSITLKVVLLILLAMGAPIILIVGIPLFLISKIKDPRLQKTATIVIFILLFVLLAAYIFFIL